MPEWPGRSGAGPLSENDGSTGLRVLVDPARLEGHSGPYERRDDSDFLLELGYHDEDPPPGKGGGVQVDVLQCGLVAVLGERTLAQQLPGLFERRLRSLPSCAVLAPGTFG